VIPMTPNERDIVYIFNDSTKNVEKCRVVATDFGRDGQYLLYGMNSKDNFIAEQSEMYKSHDECLEDEARKIDEEYLSQYNLFDSMEMILIHALHVGSAGEKLKELELKAMVNRASEFMGIDITTALDKYNKLMNNDKKKTMAERRLDYAS
jgi:hypothetical protein